MFADVPATFPGLFSSWRDAIQGRHVLIERAVSLNRPLRNCAEDVGVGERSPWRADVHSSGRGFLEWFGSHLKLVFIDDIAGTVRSQYFDNDAVGVEDLR